MGKSPAERAAFEKIVACLQAEDLDGLQAIQLPQQSPLNAFVKAANETMQPRGPQLQSYA